MEQKQVVLQNNEYTCDIDVTVEEWKEILTDETLMFSTYKNALVNFYSEPEHKSTCKALGEKYDKEPQHFNSVITNFAKAVQKKLNRFEVFGTDWKPTYWIIPMLGKHAEGYFEWTLRAELAQAMEELGMTEVETESGDNYLYSVYSDIYKSVNDSKIENRQFDEIKVKNFVFIIDEINRGEISKLK